jgi:hypothetical protein
MAEGEGLDELEYSRLQGEVSRVETLLSASASEVQTLLKSYLINATARLDFLEKKIKEHKEEKEHQQKDKAAAVAQMAQREAALSEHEKETFSGFLAKEFFTKRDFKGLEQFYSQTWDRLSEGGKEEMSHRVWEGIRRGEYKFTELPEIVQEKEAKRLYTKLTAPSVEQDRLNQIPEADRTDFLRAYEAGNQKEARQVLNRESFRRNVSLETSTGVRHQAATTGKAADDGGILADTPSESAATPPETSAMTNASRTAAALKSVELIDVTSTPSTAALPNASTPGVKGRSPA